MWASVRGATLCHSMSAENELLLALRWIKHSMHVSSLQFGCIKLSSRGYKGCRGPQEGGGGHSGTLTTSLTWTHAWPHTWGDDQSVSAALRQVTNTPAHTAVLWCRDLPLADLPVCSVVLCEYKAGVVITWTEYGKHSFLLLALVLCHRHYIF